MLYSTVILDELPKQENNNLCCVSSSGMQAFHLRSHNNSAHNLIVPKTQRNREKRSLAM
jgi:hypothetical protein